jgi:hypothetical protein
MRASTLLAALLLALPVSGCADVITSDTKVEQTITASCQAWEDKAVQAAHPSAAMIAAHDRLMALSATYNAEALAKYDDAAARQSAIEKSVQAEMNAEAIYDWKSDLQTASECWNNLALAQDIHRENQERLSELRQQIIAEQQEASVRTAPPHSAYVLHNQPTVTSVPSPVPNLGSAYEPQVVKTWGQTPCGDAVPPAMRDLPVTSTDPMIPEGCR